MSENYDEQTNGFSEQAPLCPKCGATMIKRIARRGRNAGNEFWGCSNYPRCNCIIDIIQGNNFNTDIGVVIGSRQNFFAPLYAAPYEGMQTMQSFQSLAVNQNVLGMLRNRQLEKADLINKSHFRIDSTGASFFSLTQEQRSICALVIRFLCRGSITVNNYLVSDEINKGIKNKDSICADSFRQCSINNDDSINVATDSEIELLFINNCLKPVLGSQWLNYTMTQVQLSSMLPQNINNDFIDCEQRVDFLLCYNNKNIVIEVDGQEHQEHVEKDRKRDNALASNGYTVLRITNEQVKEEPERVTEQITAVLGGIEKLDSDKELTKVIATDKIFHQLQIAIINSIYFGVFPADAKIYVLPKSDTFSKVKFLKIVDSAFSDLKKLVNAFCYLYGVDPFLTCNAGDQNSECVIEFGSNKVTKPYKSIVSDITFFGNIVNKVPANDNLTIKNCSAEAIKYFLQSSFGFSEFREGQYEAIERMLYKKDSIILLPTGSGKSLIYQLASLIVPGKIICISPLKSLMQDQIENLIYQGLDCAKAIYHGATDDSTIDSLLDPRITLIYISPERLGVKRFRDSVENLLVDNSIFAIAIDEAHCVSEWGHDFRTSYLNIGRISREIFRKKGAVPVLIALTSTASTSVLKDVQRELDIHGYDAIITPETFDRSELNFDVIKSSSGNKINVLISVLKQKIPDKFHRYASDFYKLNNDSTNCGIIFCPHASGNSPFGILKVGEEIQKAAIAQVGYYSAQLQENKKIEYSSDFKSNKVNLLVATKAFGMGIDKPNVRFTIHYGIPGSIESFYQEAGRAGRDGKQAQCIIMLSNENTNLNNEILDPSTSLEDGLKKYETIDWYSNDDVSRMLYFHFRSFKGIEMEMEMVNLLAEKIFENDILKTKAVIFNYETSIKETKRKTRKKEYVDSLENVQKGIQRLLVLGVVKDYTIDYSAKEIVIIPGTSNKDAVLQYYGDYVKGYNEGRVDAELGKARRAIISSIVLDKNNVIAVARVLVEFIYDTIEKGRRRGLREMVRVAEAALNSANSSDEIRKRVVRYFESTFSEDIDSILESKSLGFERIPIIIDGSQNELGEKIGGIRSTNEAIGLRGQVSRYLESTPDHPGLLALRAVSELCCKDYNANDIKENLSATIKYAVENYNFDKAKLLPFLIYFYKKALYRDADTCLQIYDIIAKNYDQNILKDKFIDNSSFSKEQKLIPTIVYFEKQANKICNLLSKLKGE